MKWMTAIAVTFTALGAVACESSPKPEYLGDEERELNSAMVSSYLIDQSDNAVLRQQTLYAYHFLPNTAELTELGARDVGVLANHYRFHPGHLNIRRQGAGDELYAARCAAVMVALIDGGVEADRMELGDGLPGGTGITSQEGLVIWAEMLEPPASGSSSTTTETMQRNTPITGP